MLSLVFTTFSRDMPNLSTPMTVSMVKGTIGPFLAPLPMVVVVSTYWSRVIYRRDDHWCLKWMLEIASARIHITDSLTLSLEPLIASLNNPTLFYKALVTPGAFAHERSILHHHQLRRQYAERPGNDSNGASSIAIAPNVNEHGRRSRWEVLSKQFLCALWIDKNVNLEYRFATHLQTLLDHVSRNIKPHPETCGSHHDCGRFTCRASNLQHSVL
jgi:hypothetical protein